MPKQDAWIYVSISKQMMSCYDKNTCLARYVVSTGKNGAGELEDTGRTPRGWHEVADVIGLDCPHGAVFVARVWTGDIYAFTDEQPVARDWILTRIIRLSGLEPGFNQGRPFDTYERMIYIHGTSDETHLGMPMSHGCIRMANQDVIELANWVKKGMRIYIDESFQDPLTSELNHWSNES